MGDKLPRQASECDQSVPTYHESTGSVVETIETIETK